MCDLDTDAGCRVTAFDANTETWLLQPDQLAIVGHQLSLAYPALHKV